MVPMNKLDQLFANLDRWRHYPNYQLERRADIFFSLYLRDVVQEVLGVELEDAVIPEFPIKRDLIWPDHPTDKSVKVDYVLFSRDRCTVYFVELKTDAGSRRDQQDHYLERIQAMGFGPVLEGLCSIARSTQAHQKYHHLLAALTKLGFLTMPSDIETFLYPTAQVGLSAKLRALAPLPTSAKVEIVYVQPVATPGDTCIDFETFAEHVGRSGDPFSLLFSAHLRKWREPAGAIIPRAAGGS
jgi:hypothetical protein